MTHSRLVSIRDWLDKLILGNCEAIPPQQSYSSDFKVAARFTRSLGHDVAFTELAGPDVLDEQGEFLSAMDEIVKVVPPIMSAGQCLKWSLYLAPRIQESLGYPVVVTIGQLWNGSLPVFNPRWRDLRRWARDGIGATDFARGTGINMHAWLTVSSGELIDPTLMSTLARFVGGVHEQYAGAVVFGREHSMARDHRYRPMIVGNSIAEVIAKSATMFAASVEDLGVIPLRIA